MERTAEPVLALHPSVDWIRIDADNLQLRFPTGDHITIDEGADAAEAFLNSLGRPSPPCDDQDADIRQDLVDLLTRFGALVPAGDAPPYGAFRAAADFHASAVRTKLSRAITLDQGEMAVVGDGIVADIVRELVNRLAFDHTPALLIACADSEDRNALEAANRDGIEAGRPVTFVRWARERLLVGPLVLSSRGPCYSCYTHRLRASARYPLELEAGMTIPSGIPGGHVDVAFRLFVEFVVARHLELVCAGAFHVARAGLVERWDPFSLQVVDSALLSRVPSCETCGRHGSGDPLHAVRDLI